MRRGHLLSKRYVPILTALLLWGCRAQAPAGSSSQSATAPTLTPQTGPPGRHGGFAIRVPQGGGTPQLYRMPSLAAWP
ncbi:MAG TPA: hypothetical protein VJ816_12020, partial [Gemmatimonadales bacterium]|nr:hypothetical protein [Gemmatimonadales bacterium]